MYKKDEVIKSLEKCIVERENSNKKRIYRKSENKIDLSLTQFHIIEIIDKKEKVNNKLLVQDLKISAPAISKSMRKLLDLNLVEETYLEENRKEKYYKLTSKGSVFANVHEELHKRTTNKYNEILNDFEEEELEVVIKFLNKVTKSLKED
ncbi:MarR family winged helix-turn-helix transcriptional regulator [Staphylococcus succinus]|uniref:MarR family winged helix-turn-helix transcriptional regulator n=1 Tax=Staphylococcus succinus TaxID=61015 RepID=UPI000E684C04|nr:MarR family transcriptional regulator [Staphylococcus succinus]RIN38777.1 MarR family transcriptional regulator [Staphylococcus succinus]